MKILLGMVWAGGLLYVALSATNPIGDASQAFIDLMMRLYR